MDNEISIATLVEYALQQGNIKPSDALKILSMNNEKQMKKHFIKVYGK